MARSRGADQRGGSDDPHAPLGAVSADGIRGREEPARMRRRRRRSGRPDRVLLHRDGEARRLHDAAGHARSWRRKLQRAAPVWRLGRDRAVQFPAGARGRAVRRGARGRQHRRVQTGLGDAVRRLQAVRGDEGSRRPCRPGTDREPRHRRNCLHRIEGRRHASDSRQRDAPRPASARDRDGRQEPRHGHAIGRPRQGERRRHAVGVRSAGPEVLGVLTRVCQWRRPRRVRAAPGGQNEKDRHWQSPQVRGLSRAGDQRGCGEDVRARRCPREGGRRPDPDRRTPPDRRRVCARLFRRADRHRRAADQPSAVRRGIVRPDHRHRRRHDRRRSHRSRQQYRVRADSRHLLRRRPRD